MLWFPGIGMPLGQAGLSGWRVLVEVGCVLKPPRVRGLAAVGFFQGRPVSFVSAQFALLGVIADSEYVDCMGNNGTSMLYATLVDPDYIRLHPL